MKLLMENWRGYLNEQSISYSGVVLDEESKQKLLSLSIPEGWEPVAHHMTITLGPLIHKKGKHDFSKSYPLGSEVELPVMSVGMDDRVMTAKVNAPSEISEKMSFPHVTIAVNKEGGGKPMHSKELPEENFEDVDGLTLKGIVQEIPNSAL
jgi:hypothetical protein